MRQGKISATALISATSYTTLDDIQPTFEALMSPTTQLQVVVRM